MADVAGRVSMIRFSASRWSQYMRATTPSRANTHPTSVATTTKACPGAFSKRTVCRCRYGNGKPVAHRNNKLRAKHPSVEARCDVREKGIAHQHEGGEGFMLRQHGGAGRTFFSVPGD